MGSNKVISFAPLHNAQVKKYGDQFCPLAQVQEFVTGLVDNTRTSYELEVILNHNPDGEPWQVTSSWLNLE